MTRVNDSSLLDRFGRLIIETLKDEPLRIYDNMCQGKMNSPGSKAISKVLGKLSLEDRVFIKDLLIQSTISGIHAFLFELTENYNMGEGIDILIDGNNVIEMSDGLYGELFGDKGWEARFSNYSSSEAVYEKYIITEDPGRITE